MKTAKAEDFNHAILKGYNSLLAEIEAQKNVELEDKKPEIASLLTDEIIKRYFYQEGLYNHYVLYNPEILEAKKVLNDKQQYDKILNY